MTEAEWLACTDPQKMLEFLPGKASERKLRLFACTCSRRIASLLTDERSWKAVEVLERYADGLASDEELGDALAHAATAAPPIDIEVFSGADWANVVAYILAGGGDGGQLAVEVSAYATGAADMVAGGGGVPWGAGRDSEPAAQCALLRCLIGNPFRPATLDPSWLSRDVLSLAQAAYAERIMPEGTFDPTRLALLADALEEAGCTDPDLLAHLRGPGPHVRGCWAVDLLLGKE